MDRKRICFIGSGNVATHLAPAFDNAGHKVREVFSRSRRNAEALVSKLYNAEVKPNLDFSESTCELFIISVKDAAIAEVVKEIVLPDNAILAHTSGSEPLETLLYAAPPHAGVLYPVQTFSKNKKLDVEQVPFCLEAGDVYTNDVLTYLAKDISQKVFYLSSHQRKMLHIAAVFACNFTNHLLRISKDILNKENIDFAILEALIVETINKGLIMGPENAQTGPAARGDTKIIADHMNQLGENQDYMNIYRIVSQSIIDYSLQRDESI